MRETRYLWVKNLPENIKEDKLADYFKIYGRIEKVKLNLKQNSEDSPSAIVAFVDIRSAQHAQSSLNTLEDKQLQIAYSDPIAMSSSSNRHTDQSPAHHGSNYRSFSMNQRTETSKSAEGHSGERRTHVSPANYKNYDHGEVKSSHKRKSLKGHESGSAGSTKPERKTMKIDNVKAGKKKHKKVLEERKPIIRTSKTSKQKDQIKRKSLSKKKKESFSSDEDDYDEESSSSDSDDSSEQSSSESSASSLSSSSPSNSSESSSSKSSLGSHHGEQKLVTIIIKKLPARPSVNSLRDGIYHEFKKCGKVKSVLIRGEGNYRYALVLFRNASEANKAIGHARTKLLFGAAIEASLYDGEVSGKELQECGGIIDEFHPRASRTLFIGNLDKTVQYSDIQNIFVRFGEIVAIEIKKINNIPQYAFLQYTNIASVVKAIQKMDGELLGRNMLKLGFGKTVMSSCVWVEGVTDGFTEHYLASCFHKYGSVKRVIVDRRLNQALVFYPKYEHAQKAISHLRGRTLNSSRLKLDYASHELVDVFLSRMRSSGQAVTTFDSIRHLLLPTPSGPGIPSTNSIQGSRSARSGSSHPYPGRPDPYYDDVHLSRYHGPPHGFDSGLPPRNDWRAWEERNRGRPVYQTMSPRGRRFHDERGDVYQRDGDHYDRPPPRYESDYRNPDYVRRDHDFHRGYPDDYHRIKSRDHHDPYHPHMSSPPRVGTRRSRSVSPRVAGSSGRSRGPDVELKSEIRSRDHRDHSLSRGRSPVKSPGSKDSRISASDSWQSRKPREHNLQMSPNLYLRRDDERRVELREPKSLPGSPRLSRNKTRESPDYSSSSVWSGTSGVTKDSAKPSQDFVDWEMGSYDRSRSETPTRDENTASIGEVIIKQPVVAHHKPTKHSDSLERVKGESDPVVKKKKVKSSHSMEIESKEAQSDSDNSVRRRTHSPVQEEKKQKIKFLKDSVHDKKYKSGKSKYNEDDVEKVKKNKVASLVREEKRKKISRVQDPKHRHQDKSHSKPSALIKREYSPSSLDESGGEFKKRERVSSKSSSDHRKHKILEKKSRKKQERQAKESNFSHLEDGGLHKTTRDSTKHEQEKSSVKELREGQELLKRTLSDQSTDEVGSSKRARRNSSKHEAPIPVASQSFMTDMDEDDVVVSDVVDEPAPRFRPKMVIREEVVEVESDDDSSSSSSADSSSEIEPSIKQLSKHEASSQSSLFRSKLAIAQPFQTEISSSEIEKAMGVTAQMHANDDNEESEPVSQDTSEVSESTDSQEKLVKLEEEKAKLQALLEKLDSKQELVAEEASQVADVYLSEVANRFKSKIQLKNEKKIKLQSGAGANESQKIEVVQESFVDDRLVPEVISEEIEVEQVADPPEIVEEQMIVEEEVSLAEEAVYEDTGTEIPSVLNSDSPASSQSKLLESNNSERREAEMSTLKSKYQSEKYQRSLLKKQKKEKEWHKRQVDQMRGPSQKIVSSILDEEDLEDDMVKKSETCDESKEVESEVLNLPSKSKQEAEDANTMSNNEKPPPADMFDVCADKTEVKSSTSKHSASFAIPFTSGSTPKSIKSESPNIHKIAHPSNLTDDGSRTSASPFTPVSSTNVERSSQSSGQSSTSATPLTPSPISRSLPNAETSIKSTKPPVRGGRKMSDDKRKKPESKSSHKHDNHSWKAKTPTQSKHFTNLTVSREGDFSKPLDKRELDRLCLEVARVKKELEISQGFYSPSPDAESNLPPMSPILKSPSVDGVMPDFYGKSGMSPITGMSPVIGSSPSTPLSGCSSLTERMKLLGKVKKKMKPDGTEWPKTPSDQHGGSDSQAKLKLSDSRFFRSSILDQDSQRLSHLQSTNSQTRTSIFPSLDTGELPEDKPLFSAIIEKVDTFPTFDVAVSPIPKVPKNLQPLSTNHALPADAESLETESAGRDTDGNLVESSGSASATTTALSMPIMDMTKVKEENIEVVEDVEAKSLTEDLRKEIDHSDNEANQASSEKTTENISSQELDDEQPTDSSSIHTRNDEGFQDNFTDRSIDPVEEHVSDETNLDNSFLSVNINKDCEEEKKDAENVVEVLKERSLDEDVEESIASMDVLSQDSYVAEVTDVATTEVIESENDFPLIPEFPQDILLQEVVAEESGSTTDVVMEEPETTPVEEPIDKCLENPVCTVVKEKQEIFENQSVVTGEEKQCIESTKSVSILVSGIQSGEKSEAKQKESQFGAEAKSCTNVTAKLKEVPTNVSDEIEVVMKEKSLLPFDQSHRKTTSSHSSFPKISGKSRGDSSEKKISVDKKKQEKIKKDKKEIHGSKEESSKPLKSERSSGSLKSGGEKSREKVLLKKSGKEEKAKSSSNKTKSFEGKSEKEKKIEKSRPSSMDSSEKVVKKEVKQPSRAMDTTSTSAEEKSIKSSDQSHKSLKKSEKKIKSSQVDNEKKLKSMKHESERKKEAKMKTLRDEKQSVLLSHKKHKVDENLREKHKSLSEKHKKRSDMKERDKKEKHKSGEITRESSSIKSKSKPSPSIEPMKKKMKFETDTAVKKSKHLTSLISSSDSDLGDTELKASMNVQQPKKAKTDSLTKEVIRKSEKYFPKPKPQKGLISSDDESSDNFDDFISQMGGGNSRSSFDRKSTTNLIYTSSEDSEEDISKKPPVKKLIKQDRYDSDRSDRSNKKQPTFKDKKNKDKKHKRTSEKSQSTFEKSSSKFSSTSRKASRKSSKLPAVKDSSSDEEFVRKSTEKVAKLLSGSNQSSSDEEKSKTNFKTVTSKSKVNRAETFSSQEETSRSKQTSSSKKDLKKMKVRKSSTSSSDSYDYPPPSPSSSSLLTVETIKDETVIPPGYLLDSLEQCAPKAQKSPKREAAIKSIYSTSSSSDDELEIEEKKFPEITEEDKKKFFGSSDSSDAGSSQKSGWVLHPAVSQKVKPKQKRSEQIKPEENKLKKNHKDQHRPQKSSADSKHVIKTSDSRKKETKHVVPGKHQTEHKHHSIKHKHQASERKHNLPEHKHHPIEPKHHPVESKHHPVEPKNRNSTKQDDKPVSKEFHKSSKEKRSKEKTEITSSITKYSDQKPSKKSRPEEMSKRIHADKHPKSDQHADKKSRSSHPEHNKPDKSKLAHLTGIRRDMASTSEQPRHKQDERSKVHRDPNVKPIKQKPSKEVFPTKPVKDRNVDKFKVSTIPKDFKSNREPGKTHKEKIHSVSEKKSSFHSSKPSSDLIKKESSYQSEKKAVDDLVLPSLCVDEDVKAKFDEPGRSFFCSESSDDENEDKLSIVLDPENKVKDDGSQSISFGLWKDKEDSSPKPLPTASTHKSLFSPSKDEEKSDESPSAVEESSRRDSFASVPLLSQSFVPSKAVNLSEEEKEEEESIAVDSTEVEKPLRRSSKESSPVGRTKRLSSYEKFRLEKERHREQMEQLKKESQLRDEEAVRSIMGGAESGFFIDTNKTEASTQQDEENVTSYAVVAPHSEAEVQPIVPPSNLAEEDSSEDEETSSEKPNVEPRSLAEEDELAAALRSIEGFGDFDPSKNSLAGPEIYPAPICPTDDDNNDEKEKKKSFVAQESVERESEEAAQAASALVENVSSEGFSLLRSTSEDKKEKSEPPSSVEVLLPEVEITHKESFDSNQNEEETPHQTTASYSTQQFGKSTASNPWEARMEQDDVCSKSDVVTPMTAAEQSPLSERKLPQTTLQSFAPSMTSTASQLTPQPFVSLKDPPLPAPPTLASSPSHDVVAPEKRFSPASRRSSIEPMGSLPAFKPSEMPPAGVSNIHANPHLSSFPSQPITSSVSSFVNLSASKTSSLSSFSVTSHKNFLPMMSSNPMSSFPLHAQDQASELRQLAVNKVSPSHHHPPPPPVPRVHTPQNPPHDQNKPQFTPPTGSPSRFEQVPQAKIEPPKSSPIMSAPAPVVVAQERHHVPHQVPLLPPSPQVPSSHSLPPPPVVLDSPKRPFLSRTPSSGNISHQAPSTIPPGVHSQIMVEARKAEEAHAPPQQFATTFRYPVSSVSSGHEQVKEAMRGPNPSSNASQVMPPFPPHQPIYFPQQGIPMYSIPGVPSSIPFRPPSFSGFTVPMPISQNLTQQGAHSKYMFQPRSHNPFMDIPKEGLIPAPRMPLAADTDKVRQSPPSGPLHSSQIHPAPQAREFPPKVRHGINRPLIQSHEQLGNPPDMRHPYRQPGGPDVRLSISVAGDAMKMVDQHFYMSGVHIPNSSHPSPSLLSLRPPHPGQPQYHSPRRDSPSATPVNVTSAHSVLPPGPHVHMDQLRQRPPFPVREQNRVAHIQACSSAPHQPQPEIVYSHRQMVPEPIRKQVAPPKPAQDHGQQDLQDLFQRYPIVWQGKLALKTDSAAVQLHYVAGNINIGQAGLPKQGDQCDDTGMAVLRIMQRMRIKTEHMRSLQDKMTRADDCCLLLALPCGKDQNDVGVQTNALRTGFIEYLQQKEVAGIVYVQGPMEPVQNNPKFVLHVFPPCDFTTSNLHHHASDLLDNVSDIHHLLIVVTPP